MNGSNSTVPGPRGTDGTNGTNSTVPGPAGRDGNIILPLDNTFSGSNTFNGGLITSKSLIQNIPYNIVMLGPSNNYPNYQNAGTNTSRSSTFGLNVSIGSNQLTKATGDVTNTTSIGHNNLTLTESGIGNTAIGNYILQSALGGLNTAMGYNVFPYMTNRYCTGIGANVFTSVTSGTACTGVGRNSGGYMTGSNNTCIGVSTGQLQSDTNSYSNSTALGYLATISSSNQVMLGTVSDTVRCPNILSVASQILLGGVDILTIITNAINRKQTGDLLQMKNMNHFSSDYDVRFGDYDASGTDHLVLQTILTPRSANSQITIVFDTYSTIGGYNYDKWSSKIFISSNEIQNPIRIAFKTINFTDGTSRNSTLFPIQGGYRNEYLSPLTIRIMVSALGADDPLKIQDSFSISISEVQI